MSDSFHVVPKADKKKKIVGNLTLPCVVYTGPTRGIHGVNTEIMNKKGVIVIRRSYRFQKGTAGKKISEPVIILEDLEWFRDQEFYEVVTDKKHLSQKTYDIIADQTGELERSLKAIKEWEQVVPFIGPEEKKETKGNSKKKKKTEPEE